MDPTCPLQGQADCKANFDLILWWLSQCELHQVCTKTPNYATEFPLPTRLIDVNPGSKPGTPRLVLSADLGEATDCRYTALSHCWGVQGKVPKTLRDTLIQHQERITGLSKTFEDAVEVTRQIGVRYLWIDSLCILQDDANDFQKECSRMSLVYAGSYCMLSAADSEDGSGGLFIPRTSFGLQYPEHPINYWTSLLKGPLSTRGWAFQEHQLSPRIVHFTKTRILWECRTCVAFEDFPSQVYRGFIGRGCLGADWKGEIDTWRLFDGHQERYEKKIDWGLKIPRSAVHIPPPANLDNPNYKEDIRTRWLRAAELYSARNLSHETDKLPAISGLAAAVARLVEGDVYLAGIWEGDLIRGLLWRSVLSDTRVTTTKRASNIPSWSWASYCGRINFLASVGDAYIPTREMARDLIATLDGSRPAIKVEYIASIKARTSVLGLDPFGSVRSGTLQITTLIKSYDIGTNPWNNRCWTLDEGRDFRIFLDDESSQSHSGVVFALLLSGSDGSRSSFGLLLLKSHLDTFHRIGIFHTWEVAVLNSFRLETLTVV
jgi:hypothetical protein